MNSISLQIILVIIATAVVISVADNILDTMRVEEATERALREGEAQFNATKQEQQETKRQVEEHASYAKRSFELIQQTLATQNAYLEDFERHANTTSTNMALQLETLDRVRNLTSSYESAYNSSLTR